MLYSATLKNDVGVLGSTTSSGMTLHDVPLYPTLVGMLSDRTIAPVGIRDIDFAIGNALSAHLSRGEGDLTAIR